VEKDRAKEEALRANLVAIIRLTCREFLNNNDAGVKKTRQACELLSKEKPSDEDLTQVGNLLFQVTGMTLDQLKTELSRTGTTEFVQQMHEPDVENLKERWNAKNIPKKIPIEQTGSRTVSLDGRDDTLDIEHSAEFKKQDYTVGNTIHLSREEVISSVADKFCEQGLVVSKWPVPERVEMVMLPDGQKDGKAVLYYTYKMEVVAKKERVDPRQKPDSCSKEKQTDEGKRAPLPGQEAFEPIPEVPYLVYIDAQSNRIRELRALLKRNGTVEALGWTIRRDPSVEEAEPETSTVDSAHEVTGYPTEGYTLQLERVFTILGENVFIDANNRTRADFRMKQVEWPSGYDTQKKKLNVKMVACEIGDEHREPGNRDFERIDLMATLNRYRRDLLGLDIIKRPFPAEGRIITIEFPGQMPNCDAYVSAGRQLVFGRCQGYGLPACPSVADFELSPVHDHTIVAHEFGHVLMDHIYDRNSGSISSIFHDFADAWVQVLEGTNCVGGWWYRNMPGHAPENPCNGKGDPDRGLPRVSRVPYPGEAMKKEDQDDHFPEHRSVAEGEYANMQIAAAALWASREGLRSRALAVGTSLYLVRFVNAVTGLSGFARSRSKDKGYDQDVYDGLFQLQQQLMSQWNATKLGDINKVAAGFARTGLFLIPAVCLDGKSSTHHRKYCKDEDSGADAVIDIDDNNLENDAVINGVKQRRVDFLTRYKDDDHPGTRPFFHVWTGPRYLFDRKDAKLPEDRQQPATCNSRYQIKVTVGGGTLGGQKTITSDVLTVETAHDKPVIQQCYGMWEFPKDSWKDLSQGTTLTYEVETWTPEANGDKRNQRFSTKPGNGVFGTFALPSAVINDPQTP